MAKTGTVYLVGAGPGDPGLITVKGHQLLQRADAVVYDHLVGDELLDVIKTDAEKVYVGKQDSRHTMKQEQINQLLVDKAKEGKEVVRLKGGDPFVFGRGGEEALHLVANGVPFEVVPGITSAVAAPAYAGIPVTHRDHTSSVTIVTGHQRTDRTVVGIDWKALANNKGTLVFLMGVHNLPNIVGKLLEEGKPPDTPIALVQWGTCKEQVTVQSTMDTIVAEVRKAGMTPPAVIVVGEVAGLRDQLKWYK